MDERETPPENAFRRLPARIRVEDMVTTQQADPQHEDLVPKGSMSGWAMGRPPEE